MSFLDDLKKKSKVEGESNPPAPTENKPKVNPLLKKNPLLGANATKTTEAKVAAKPNPFIPKKNPLNVSNGEEERKKAVEAVKKEQEETNKTTAKEETKVETPKVEESKKEEKNEPEAAKKEPTETKPAEDHKKNAGKRKSSKKSETTSKVEESSDVEEIEIPTTEIDYEKAVEGVTTHFEDKTWNDLKKSVEDELSAIKISAEMNPGTLMAAVENLNTVRDSIESQFYYYKNLYQSLAPDKDKPEGLLTRIKYLAYTNDHKNDADRRRAGILACLNYKTPEGKNVNLYELLDETRERFLFLDSKMKTIDYKAKALITMNGALKIDASLTTK